ncbi:MAG TPA: hypothetical protein VIN09_01990 [Chloroflexota bacterium]
MVEVVTVPAIVPAEGGKRIEEFFGAVRSLADRLSLARMWAPPGWSEPAQVGAFDEVVIVLDGALTVEIPRGRLDVGPHQVCWVRSGQPVRFANRGATPCTYWSLCAPAFRPERRRWLDEGIFRNSSTSSGVVLAARGRPVAGVAGIEIEEYVGLQATGDDALSVARLTASARWAEPWQTTAFHEVAFPVAGAFTIAHGGGVQRVAEGQACLVPPSRHQWRNDDDEPCTFWSVCLPAFSMARATRETA